jgi:two-component sensor histidine kinase
MPERLDPRQGDADAEVSPADAAGSAALSRAGWLVQGYESSPVAQYFTDGEGRILHYNEAASALWGRKPAIGEDRWCGAWRLRRTNGEPLPHEASPMALAIREKRANYGDAAIVERPDGTLAPFLAFPTPLLDSTGAVVQAASMLVDVSQQRQPLDQQQALVNELNHRVKNTLSSVQSLAAHSFRGGQDLRRMRQAFDGRLMALSQAHNHLAEHDWQAADLRVLVQQALADHFSRGHAVLVDGPPVRLPARVAPPLAVALHELSVNAGRHGALAREGRLAVAWVCEPDAVRLTWIECGARAMGGPVVRGFGLRFTEDAVTRELGGQARFDFLPEGLRCELEIPLPPK